jgi:hypothetical protein
LYRGRRNQHVETAEHRDHTVRGSIHLFQVAHIGADTKGSPALMFDLELREVEFRLRA